MIKCTALFNSVSNVSGNAQAQTRTGGWSESIYNSQEIDAARADFLDYCVLRARCLPAGFAIIGQRYQIVDGPSSTGGRRFPGDAALSCDVPQMALQLKADASGAVNVRRWSFRGVPDAMITEGEYLPTSSYRTAVLNAAQFATGGNWRFYGKDLTWTLYDIVSISAGGLLTTALDPGFNAGMQVQLFRCKDEAGNGVSGTFLIGSNGTGNSWNLVNYNRNAAVSGQVRRITYTPYPIVGASVVVEKVVVRKVGRPFGGYSGRHSKRT